MTKRFRSITRDILPPVFTLAVLIAVWSAVTGFEAVPSFMLPSPGAVLSAFVNNIGYMAKESVYTLQEAVYGLLAGIVLAFILATLMDKFTFAFKAYYPLLVISQTIPTIAIAPLLVLWMGYGMAPRITLVIITTFFPVAVGLLDGYKSVDADSVNLMRSMGAGKIQIYRHVKFPGAVPGFFSGLRIASSYAVIGALIAEWLGGNNGLGVYMTRVKKAYSFDKMFAVIIFICIVSLALMAAVRLIEKLSMPYKIKSKENR
ncbi:MAG: ABC transporter permease [Clostridia bacterium]|nr:ABC transporter permease [Clostridia bacterium]